MSAEVIHRRLLRWLGALRLTLWLLGLLALNVGAVYVVPVVAGSWLALPFSLLALNLLAALATNFKFRSQLPLLLFHLALLLLLLLVAAGRLSYLKGWVEVTSGDRFSGKLTGHEKGPLHNWRLEEVDFRLDRFEIDYDPGVQRGATRAHLQWRNEAGVLQRGIVGDHRPLVLAGYRFYTSHNKGFAPIFTWTTKQGTAISGSIHLPAYPANQYSQALEWSPPGSGIKLWTQLQFDEEILAMDAKSQFRTPTEHLLVVRVGDQRYELKSGETISLENGTLRYERLGSWMGFNVLSDWTIPWLLATAMFAVFSLGWHYWRKFALRPWDESSTEES